MLVVRLTIIQPTLSKTERWVKRFDRWTEDFYHLNYVFPNFTYCINCDLFTGHGAIKSYTVCEIFSLCKRIYSRQELRPTMTQFCRWGGILHFSFLSPWVIATYYNAIRMYWFPFCAKALYKITFSRQFIQFYTFVYTHTRYIYYIYL